MAGEDFPDENGYALVVGPEETMNGEETRTEDSFLVLNVASLGILEIEKIDLRLPVLKGSSLANLKIGAGLLEDCAEIGAPGNTVLTAHRSYTYGRFFNRLDEIEAGDEIVIATQENTCRYVVYNKVIVEPDDTFIIGGDKEEKILTLVTCHPIHNATHRLIVQARMIEEDEGENAEEAGKEKMT